MYRILFISSYLTTRKQQQFGTDGIYVFCRAIELYFQIGLIFFVIALILVYQYRIIHIIYHEVQVSIIIQVGIYRAVRKCFLIILYAALHIIKRNIAGIPVKLIG